MADDLFEDALDGTRPRRTHDARPVASAMMVCIREPEGRDTEREA